MYSNSDFGLLRLIMEKASGKNLSEWTRQRIFNPLKMSNTRMQKNALDVVPNLANKYSNTGNSFKNAKVQKTSPGGDYFILTCADDLAKLSLVISDPRLEFNAAFNKLLENVRMIPGKKITMLPGIALISSVIIKLLFMKGLMVKIILAVFHQKDYQS